MEIETYKSIISVIRHHKGLSRNCKKLLIERFPHIKEDTIGSILSLEYQKLMKMNHNKSLATQEKYYRLYKEAVDNGESPGIIVRLAMDFNVTPSLIAKLVLKHHMEKNTVGSPNEAGHNIKISACMKDTSLIDNMDLSYEIYLAELYDDQYGPVIEAIKQAIGQQYEIQLHKQITELGLAFMDEEDLRKFGYDKTPDVKLEVPVAIDGFIINWIESKASFGDEEAHHTYCKEQYLSYWNRFGPGIVIYWFGFLETIQQHNDKRFIIRDHLPTNLTHISPPSLLLNE